VAGGQHVEVLVTSRMNNGSLSMSVVLDGALSMSVVLLLVF